MTTLLRQSQKLLKVFPKRCVCIRCQKWVHCRIKPTHNKSLCDYMKIKLKPVQQYVFHRHFHITSSGVTKQVENLEREEFLKVLEGMFGQKVYDLMIILNEKQDVLLTDDDWETILESMKKDDPTQGLDGDAILMELFAKKNLPEIGISLMQYVKKKKVPSLISFTALIAMCGKKYPDIVFREYEELLKHNFSVDAKSYLKLIKGFSQTSNWKKCLEFLAQITVRTEFEKGVWLVMKAALANNDMRTFNLVLSSACDHEGIVVLPDSLRNELYSAWENGHIDTKTFLSILSEYKGFLDSEKAKKFAEKLNRKEDSFKVHWGEIIKGSCSVCGEKLRGETITASQIETLKERLHKYISKKNVVYMHSSPKEYDHFCSWMEINGPFDLVFDVPNLYYQNPNWNVDKVIDGMLHIQKLMAPEGKVLYVTPFNYFRMFKMELKKKRAGNKAHIYSPKKKSDDDLFMILAVLHSGPNCHIVSGDHFRDMKANLGEDLKPLFEHWQRCQQVLVKGMQWSNISNAKPQQYDFCVQKHSNGWHVPYILDRENEPTYTVPGKLLCLQSDSYPPCGDGVIALENSAPDKRG